MQQLSIDDLSRIIELQQDVASSSETIEELMKLICSQTQTLTFSEGAVIEFPVEDKMVYISCTGILESALGLKINRIGSLSGLCVDNADVLYCSDSETDQRVDREATRRAGIRSMICVPLLVKNAVIGVLKVVSKNTNNFSDREIAILRVIAGVLSSAIAQAKANEAIMASERKFRTLIEDASDAILISKNGIALEANMAFCELYGYAPEEIPGLDVLNLIPSEDRESIRALLSKGSSELYETRAMKKNGDIIYIEAIGKTHLINGDKIRVSTSRDISVKKKIEEALKLSELKAREAAQAKSQFLANMSHEIRTPLNGILGMSTILLDTDLKSDQKEYVKILNSSAEGLLNIVNDILDYSKIEAKKLLIESIKFDLKEKTSEICSLLKFTAEQKGLKFNMNFAPDLPSVVTGDPYRLRQVIMNLVSNAIKFTEKGSVTLEIFKKNNSIRFEIRDTGIGIDNERIHLIFSPFVQVDSSSTRKFGGTGLGLSISKELIESMKGSIGIESELGKGSLFWFELPLLQSEFITTSKEEQKAATSLSQKRVLIVEDNDVNALIAKKMVEKLGHLPVVVPNGLEAVKILKTDVFDLILMDCQMPIMDGFKTTRLIRESNGPGKDVIIVAMTAHAMNEDKERCLASGMNDYLSKPMKITDISGVLAKYFQI